MGNNGFDVEIADMDLIRQVFERQRSHLQAIGTYVDSTCRASGAFSGVLSFVAGDYGRAVDDAEQGYRHGETIASTCASKVSETKAALLETDRKQYERYAAHERALGHQPPPYAPPPGGGTLGPAGSSATSDPSGHSPLKINNVVGDRTKKIGDTLAIDPNRPWDRSDPNAVDHLDPKYWGRRGVEAATDAGRHSLGLDGEPGRHRVPYPTWPEGTGSTAKDLGTALSAPVSAVNNGVGIVTAGRKILSAQQLQQQLDAASQGPSNTTGYDWATQPGGGW